MIAGPETRSSIGGCSGNFGVTLGARVFCAGRPVARNDTGQNWTDLQVGQYAASPASMACAHQIAIDRGQALPIPPSSHGGKKKNAGGNDKARTPGRYRMIVL